MIDFQSAFGPVDGYHFEYAYLLEFLMLGSACAAVEFSSMFHAGQINVFSFTPQHYHHKFVIFLAFVINN